MSIYQNMFNIDFNINIHFDKIMIYPVAFVIVNVI